MLTAILCLIPVSTLVPAAGGHELRSGEVVEGELGRRLDGFLSALEGLGFSGVVGIEDQGKPILIRGYGNADREHETPVTPATVFCTGSITKQFTAAAILALQDEGKLSVQDPLAKYFEHVPEDKRGITLHHLLTHSSGLVDSRAGDYDLVATADWVRDQALGCKLEFAPGHGYSYQNVNFSLLGMIVERVSGQPYETFLQQRLFARAGLARTGYLAPKYAPGEIATGYLDDERWGTTLDHALLPDGPCWTLRANGGIQATVGDMLRWHHALQEDHVLSRAAHAALETPFVPEGGGTSYGYGWSIDTSPSGKKLVTHNGGNQVSFADFLRFVEEDRVIFLATNAAYAVRQDLAFELAGILYGRPPRAVPATIPRDHATLAAYAGRYALGEDSALVVEDLGDRLVLTGVGEYANELLLDDKTRGWVDEARGLAEEICAGNDAPFVACYGGRQSPDSIRAELSAARARWNSSVGAFRQLGDASVRPGPDTRILIELRFERGTAYLMTRLGQAGRVVGFQCLDSAPFTGAPRIELFPLSKQEFTEYNDRRGAGMKVGFELGGSGPAKSIGIGDPRLTFPRE
jgi:CubicO group peptidase (beta-lactamase class C family)